MDKEKIKIPTPEDGLQKFLTWFNKDKILAFLITLFIGIITHITMLTETIMSQDGLWNSMEYFRPGEWEISLGRWGIEIIQRLNQFIAIPTISTIFSIIIISITAVILIDIFDFKSKISIIFTSLILAVAPTLTATLLYVYTSFAYCFSFFIATLVVWFIYKFKNQKLGFVLASLCLMFSLSIYQSNIGVTIGLCLMISIIELMKGKNIKSVLFNILKTAVVVIVGAILYYIVTEVILKVSNIEISAYKNAEAVSILEIIKGLKNTIIQTYSDFFTFFFKNEIIYNTNYRREVLYGILFLCFIISSIVSLISINEKDIKKKFLRISCTILIILIIPIALNIIDIIIVGNEMYALTSAQMILVIPFIFGMLENINNKLATIKWICTLVCLIILGTYYISDNASYAALKLTYNQAYSTTMRIMDRIETTDGYSKGLPILFGGIVGNNNYPRTSTLYNYTIGSMVNNTAFHGTYGGANGTWFKFLKIFYGLDVQICSPEEYTKIINSKIYKEEMEIFPASSSVRIIDGIVVVKLSDEPSMPY